MDPESYNYTRCQVCGRQAPTAHVVFHRHIGALVMMFHNHIEGNLCRDCIEHYFWNFTGMTLGLGWWGCISVVVTPICLLMNVVRYLGVLSLPRANADP
jgi:hypothetical protein